MRFNIAILIIFMLFAAAVLAEQDFPNFVRGSKVDLHIICKNITNTTESFCSGSAACNMTVLYPNQSIMVSNAAMSNSVSYFNYTVPSTRAIGKFSTIISCCDAGSCRISTPSFMIGTTTWDSLSPMTLIIALGIMAFLMIFTAYILPPDHVYLQTFLMISGIITVVFLIPSSLMSQKVITMLYTLGNYSWILLTVYFAIFLIAFLVDKYIIQPGKQIANQNDQENM